MKLNSDNETLAENKVLILYVLSLVNKPISNDTLYSIVNTARNPDNNDTLNHDHDLKFLGYGGGNVSDQDATYWINNYHNDRPSQGIVQDVIMNAVLFIAKHIVVIGNHLQQIDRLRAVIPRLL